MPLWRRMVGILYCGLHVTVTKRWSGFWLGTRRTLLIKRARRCWMTQTIKTSLKLHWTQMKSMTHSLSLRILKKSENTLLYIGRHIRAISLSFKFWWTQNLIQGLSTSMEITQCIKQLRPHKFKSWSFSCQLELILKYQTIVVTTQSILPPTLN